MSSGGPLGLTSVGLAIVLVVLAVAAPVGVGLLWWWRRPARRWLTGTLGVGAVVVGQVAAVAAVFALVNQQYDFYASWSDLLGNGSAATSDQGVSTGTSHPGGGRTEVIHIAGTASHASGFALVWLPRQYDEPAYRHHRFPVVEFLPGQPEQPLGAFSAFNLASDAAHEIDSGRVAPFVLVVPPLMIRPPHDTECTNIPHGPQALTWLSQDVPHAITARLRVQPPGRHWSVMGWSTGGFCAAKLLYTDHREFASAVSIGAYFQPITEGSWPRLFGVGRHAQTVRRLNSPQWLYRHTLAGLRARLLIVSSRQDKESWPSTARMLAVTTDSTAVGHIALTDGGHNFRVYEPYVGPALRWLATTGSLGSAGSTSRAASGATSGSTSS
ncbi:hypothetical protein D9V37_08550 [Nocardioides mangrovicus]|uniref:Esterase n=1 Tax=Nocardioides mangrovicus TaxID=2478913 RepID=A0A3L8P652_9ACTN|nr:alpha/beta hydrolase-fold protein [Nocardioides mangrovicus]RLV49918.1 hypothetical protein D9V37_08550 [Nocardioides mangrovicus]